jgi:endonuclease YncB( thermonuclease family)
MNSKRIIASAVFGMFLMSGLSALVIHAHAANSDVIEGTATVIDAGTVKIGDKIIKLHGLIAPSARQKCKSGSLPWLCGAAARAHLVKLAQGETIRCLKVGAYHGRCFKGGTDLGESLVRNGWAVPDKAGAVYHDDEDAARAEKLGMWKYTK